MIGLCAYRDCICSSNLVHRAFPLKVGGKSPGNEVDAPASTGQYHSQWAISLPNFKKISRGTKNILRDDKLNNLHFLVFKAHTLKLTI